VIAMSVDELIQRIKWVYDDLDTDNASSINDINKNEALEEIRDLVNSFEEER
jgi:hypothetical protein